MNFDEFCENWTEWRAGRLDAVMAARMEQKRARCEACQRYDRQMRRMLSELKQLPLPVDTRPRQQQVAPSVHRHGRWGVRLAAAAVVVIAFGAGLATQAWLGGDGDEVAPTVAEAVEVAPGQVRDVHVAVSVTRDFDTVEFMIELPRAVELDGYPGQRIVRWEGRLEQGRSRLTLPLVIGEPDQGAEVIARIRHADGENEIRIPLASAIDTGNAV